MKQTFTMDDALSPEETDATAAAFAQCISEIDRHLEEMRPEQEAIRRTGERTDATLAEISEILARSKPHRYARAAVPVGPPAPQPGGGHP